MHAPAFRFEIRSGLIRVVHKAMRGTKRMAVKGVEARRRVLE
jgi:hypothetical protein